MLYISNNNNIIIVYKLHFSGTKFGKFQIMLLISVTVGYCLVTDSGEFSGLGSQDKS